MPWTTGKRSYLDPIHQDIILDRSKPSDELIIQLIDTPEFQRLRRIQQLGVSSFTFQGAEGSRFTHSVGVMHLASRLTDMLAEDNPVAAEIKPVIVAAALLHDVGHGPYSHVTEKIVGYNHEDWSGKLITGDTTINQILSSFSPDLPNQVASVLNKSFQPHWVSHIVSSQLDCDRFDYLLRDSYMTGTTYGAFALQRILSSLEIDQSADQIVVSGEKGLIAVEDYLFARYSMYAQVYYHKKNIAARALLMKLVKRAGELGSKICFMDESTQKWLLGSELTVNDYLELDDVQMTYHIKRWIKEADPILSDLAARFLHRRLFKASRLPCSDETAVASIHQAARAAVAKIGLDPDYYVCVETTGIRPYDYYRPTSSSEQTSIMVRTNGSTVQELSTLSPMVQALVKGNFETVWLICPAEAQSAISSLSELASSQ